MIIAADPDDYDTWEDHEEARRIEPDPERLNAFVATQLSDTRDLISRRRDGAASAAHPPCHPTSN